jgi:hypothetical protein
MLACPTNNQIFHIFVRIYYIGQVKISLGQPVLAFYLPDGQVVQKVNVEPCEFVNFWRMTEMLVFWHLFWLLYTETVKKGRRSTIVLLFSSVTVAVHQGR